MRRLLLILCLPILVLAFIIFILILSVSFWWSGVKWEENYDNEQ